jgi:hypothetical protein
MASDPKAIAALIVGKKVKPPMGPGPMDGSAAPGEGEGTDMDPDKAQSTAVEDILSAIESKDVGLLKSALTDFVAMCEKNEPEGY